MFSNKQINKYPATMYRSDIFFIKSEYISHLFLSVFIVDSEQVYLGWETATFSLCS